MSLKSMPSEKSALRSTFYSSTGFSKKKYGDRVPSTQNSQKLEMNMTRPDSVIEATDTSASLMLPQTLLSSKIFFYN